MRFIIVFSLVFGAQHVFGWGHPGHHVVGEIAQSHLTELAQAKINAILENQTLAEVSNWMDNIKSDSAYDSLRNWHWVTIPDGMTYEEMEKDEAGDIIAGIEYVVGKLKEGKLSPDMEADFIKILVHLVGDVHMPLHVGNGEDRGGNKIEVEWFWQKSNIHRVWDSQMIDSKNYSYTELATLLNRHNVLKIEEWQSTSVREWAMECVAYRPQIYDLPEDKKINYEYRYKNWDLLCNQLRKGGVRLAGLLNEIYG